MYMAMVLCVHLFGLTHVKSRFGLYRFIWSKSNIVVEERLNETSHTSNILVNKNKPQKINSINIELNYMWKYIVLKYMLRSSMFAHFQQYAGLLYLIID